jgi:hypothetical protein
MWRSAVLRDFPANAIGVARNSLFKAFSAEVRAFCVSLRLFLAATASPLRVGKPVFGPLFRDHLRQGGEF